MPYVSGKACRCASEAAACGWPARGKGGLASDHADAVLSIEQRRAIYHATVKADLALKATVYGCCGGMVTCTSEVSRGGSVTEVRKPFCTPAAMAPSEDRPLRNKS